MCACLIESRSYRRSYVVTKISRNVCRAAADSKVSWSHDHLFRDFIVCHVHVQCCASDLRITLKLILNHLPKLLNIYLWGQVLNITDFQDMARGQNDNSFHRPTNYSQGGEYFLIRANGDVALDGVAFSRLNSLSWGRILNWVTRMGPHIFWFWGNTVLHIYG